MYKNISLTSSFVIQKSYTFDTNTISVVMTLFVSSTVKVTLSLPVYLIF